MLTCTVCGSTVPLLAMYVSDLVQRTKIGPCCISEPGDDISKLDLSAFRFIGDIDQSVVRVNQTDARNMISSYLETNSHQGPSDEALLTPLHALLEEPVPSSTLAPPPTPDNATVLPPIGVVHTVETVSDPLSPPISTVLSGFTPAGPNISTPAPDPTPARPPVTTSYATTTVGETTFSTPAGSGSSTSSSTPAADPAPAPASTPSSGGTS